METKVYDITYKYQGYSNSSNGTLAIDRVNATAVYINEHGQLVVANDLRQVKAFAKDVWIKFEEVKPSEDS